MKSRNLLSCLDHIFWWLMWLLPLVGGIVAIAAGGTHDFTSFYDFVNNFHFTFVADILTDILAVTDIQLPAILVSLTSYLVSVEICHVFVDVLVFLPRLCHKMVNADEYIHFGRK